MTWNDLVRKYIPNASENECEYILWNKTAYPCTLDKDLIEEQIIEYINENMSNSNKL